MNIEPGSGNEFISGNSRKVTEVESKIEKRKLAGMAEKSSVIIENRRLPRVCS